MYMYPKYLPILTIIILFYKKTRGGTTRLATLLGLCHSLLLFLFSWDYSPLWLGDINEGGLAVLQSTKIRQSKINSRSVAGPIGQTNRPPSVWCSKYYFFIISCKILCKNHFNLFSYFLYIYKTWKKEFWAPLVYKKLLKKNERIFWKIFARNYEKIILGT